MKIHYPMQYGLALMVALIVVVLSMSPALAQAGERSHHARAGYHSEYNHHGGNGYSVRRHGRHGHEKPVHVVRHEVVYEVHRPIHREVVYAQPYISLNIPLPLPHFLH